MKTIGIMSMQRIHNYGSYMQAYGLKQLIGSLGYNVEFVDYEFEKELTHKKKENIVSKLLRNKNILRYAKKKKIVNEFHKRFAEEFIPTLCDKINVRPSNIDTLVIGSDEVFNCLQAYPVGYSRELFGKNYENIPVISYAACFGQTTYDRLKDYDISDEVSNLLKKFKSISVRDDNSYNTVLKLTGIKPTINLDPVLIYDYEKENIDNVKIDNYILIYAYSGRLTTEEEKYIKKFAKKHNKKIVSLGMYQKIADYNLVVSPFEMLAYFKHANYVITDTFHGSIFSIKTHSKFCTIVLNNTNGNSNKLVDLLERLHLKDRIVTDVEEIENKYLEGINYDDTDMILEVEKQHTMQYLMEVIGNE